MVYSALIFHQVPVLSLMFHVILSIVFHLMSSQQFLTLLQTMMYSLSSMRATRITSRIMKKRLRDHKSNRFWTLNHPIVLMKSYLIFHSQEFPIIVPRKGTKISKLAVHPLTWRNSQQ